MEAAFVIESFTSRSLVCTVGIDVSGGHREIGKMKFGNPEEHKSETRTAGPSEDRACEGRQIGKLETPESGNLKIGKSVSRITQHWI